MAQKILKLSPLKPIRLLIADPSPETPQPAEIGLLCAHGSLAKPEGFAHFFLEMPPFHPLSRRLPIRRSLISLLLLTAQASGQGFIKKDITVGYSLQVERDILSLYCPFFKEECFVGF